MIVAAAMFFAADWVASRFRLTPLDSMLEKDVDGLGDVDGGVEEGMSNPFCDEDSTPLLVMLSPGSCDTDMMANQ